MEVQFEQLGSSWGNVAAPHGSRITKKVGAIRLSNYFRWESSITKPSSVMVPACPPDAIDSPTGWRDRRFLELDAYIAAGWGNAPNHVIEKHLAKHGNLNAPPPWHYRETLTGKVKSTKPPSARLLTYDGETKSLKEWSELTGIHPGCLASRMRLGWEPERVLLAPASVKRQPKRKLTTDQIQTARQMRAEGIVLTAIAQRLGISLSSAERAVRR